MSKVTILLLFGLLVLPLLVSRTEAVEPGQPARFEVSPSLLPTDKLPLIPPALPKIPAVVSLEIDIPSAPDTTDETALFKIGEASLIKARVVSLVGDLQSIDYYFTVNDGFEFANFTGEVFADGGLKQIHGIIPSLKNGQTVEVCVDLVAKSAIKDGTLSFGVTIPFPYKQLMNYMETSYKGTERDMIVSEIERFRKNGGPSLASLDIRIGTE
jgi:hypothetical protein